MEGPEPASRLLRMLLKQRSPSWLGRTFMTINDILLQGQSWPCRRIEAKYTFNLLRADASLLIYHVSVIPRKRQMMLSTHNLAFKGIFRKVFGKV